MKTANILGLLTDWWAAVKVATPPTFRAVIANPRLLLNLPILSKIFFSHVWTSFAPLVDEGGREVKKGLITPYAYGVVLDIGAGHGHTMHYLDRRRITKYVALEPNQAMHPEIRKIAISNGYDEEKGELQILGCGAEDIEYILKELGGEHRVDTLVSILTLCSIPSPQTTITNLTNRCLKPAGQILYYEHVQSPLSDVQWWQSVWAPMWSLVFDGCRLDRPTHVWVQDAAVWNHAVSEVWGKPGEEEENLFWHRVGRLVKAS